MNESLNQILSPRSDNGMCSSPSFTSPVPVGSVNKACRGDLCCVKKCHQHFDNRGVTRQAESLDEGARTPQVYGRPSSSPERISHEA